MMELQPAKNVTQFVKHAVQLTLVLNASLKTTEPWSMDNVCVPVAFSRLSMLITRFLAENVAPNANNVKVKRFVSIVKLKTIEFWVMTRWVINLVSALQDIPQLRIVKDHVSKTDVLLISTAKIVIKQEDYKFVFNVSLLLIES